MPILIEIMWLRFRLRLAFCRWRFWNLLRRGLDRVLPKAR
jgi:hypothetical protein